MSLFSTTVIKTSKIFSQLPTDSQSESSKSCKLERQPSLLIDSFAQTDAQSTLLDTATGGASSNDMVDSGVDSQHKSIFKERNISVTEDDEGLSFSDDRFRDKNIMSEEEDEAEKPSTAAAAERRDDPEEVSAASILPSLPHLNSTDPDPLLLCFEITFLKTPQLQVLQTDFKLSETLTTLDINDEGPGHN